MILNLDSKIELGIVIQCFNKAELTIQCLQSLLKMSGSAYSNLIVYQDGFRDGKFSKAFSTEHAETAERVQQWLVDHGSHFKSSAFRSDEKNYGTCKTCQKSIDLAFETNDVVLFSEDDVIFEVDALIWFLSSFQSSLFHDDSVWAIAGESKCFDSRGREVAPWAKKSAIEFAVNNNLISRAMLMNFLPSSCFFTNASKWRQFRSERGNPNGDRDVNIRCKNEGKKSLWPVIARCRDVGMHNPLGFSVTVKKGDLGKIAQKSVYLTSGDLQHLNTPSLDENLLLAASSVILKMALDYDLKEGVL